MPVQLTIAYRWGIIIEVCFIKELLILAVLNILSDKTKSETLKSYQSKLKNVIHTLQVDFLMKYVCKYQN